MDRLHTTARLVDLATRQDGVVTRGQLLALGLTEAAIESRLRRGALLRLHQGVYAVGHRSLSARGRRRAALLAVPGGVLSHVSAAAARGIWRDRAVGVQVTTAGEARSSPGITVHRTRTLPAGQVSLVDGLPCTSVERVLRDMAAFWSTDELLRAAGNAEVRGLLDVDALLALDLRGVRGARRLRDVREHYAEGTRSELERRFRRLCRERGLPLPVGQLDVAGRRVDFAWPELRFGVEAQSWKHHTGLALEADAAKQARWTAAGWVVIPVTWRQLRSRPQEVLRALAARSVVPDRSS